MKKGFLILAVALVAGALSFYLSRSKSGSGSDSLLLDSMPELVWLHTDLNLTDEQFSKVEKLHRDYRPICDEMCRRIAASQDAVAKLANSQGEMSEDLSKAIENHGNVIAECKRAMLEHIYRTASLMDESQAQRYLRVAVPLALDTAHGYSTTRNYE